MPTQNYTLTTLASSQAFYNFFETGNYPTFTTVAGGLPFTADDFVDASGFTRVYGFLFSDDLGIPSVATINSVKLNTTHNESLAGKFNPEWAYRVNDTSSNQTIKTYDAGNPPFGTSVVTWVGTQATNALTGLPFTRAEIFSLVWGVVAHPAVGSNPADPWTYVVSGLSLVVNATTPDPVTVSVTGQGGLLANSKATVTLNKEVYGQGGPIVGAVSDPWAYGSGAPLALHGDQWGIMEFDLKPRTEDAF